MTWRYVSAAALARIVILNEVKDLTERQCSLP
jgi:hypothetical protein